MAPKAEGTSRRIRVAALLLIAELAAGPVGTHVYWMLGGTWGLYNLSGARDEVATTGTRVVAAVVVLLLVAAVLVVLARVGFWQQGLLSDRLIRFFAWALAAVFLVEAVAAFTWSREHEWWMYGPVSLVIGLLALVVACSGGEWRRIHWPHRTLPSH
jgi:cytochrome bd-type quinol oxidase subunit 2